MGKITSAKRHSTTAFPSTGERLKIMRRTAGSISPKRAKQILAYIANGRKEWEQRVENLPWPKRPYKK